MSGGPESGTQEIIEDNTSLTLHIMQAYHPKGPYGERINIDTKTAEEIASWTTTIARKTFQKWVQNTDKHRQQQNKEQAEELYLIFKRLKTAWSPQDAALLEQKLLAMITGKPYIKTEVVKNEQTK